jgi:hypothetical protein
MGAKAEPKGRNGGLAADLWIGQKEVETNDLRWRANCFKA